MRNYRARAARRRKGREPGENGASSAVARTRANVYLKDRANNFPSVFPPSSPVSTLGTSLEPSSLVEEPGRQATPLARRTWRASGPIWRSLPAEWDAARRNPETRLPWRVPECDVVRLGMRRRRRLNRCRPRMVHPASGQPCMRQSLPRPCRLRETQMT